MSHQFELFSFDENKPKGKVPISAKRIQEIKELIANKDGKTAAQRLRDLNDSLEEFEKRITNKRI